VVSNTQLMRMALDLIKKEAFTPDADVPVGALIVDSQGRIIAESTNRKEKEKDPTAHAEILVLRKAGGVTGSPNLSGLTLVVTLEPCAMCAGAIAQARVSRLVFGAWDSKAGAAGSKHDLVRDRTLPHRVSEVVGGVLERDCQEVLKDFFATLKGSVDLD